MSKIVLQIQINQINCVVYTDVFTVVKASIFYEQPDAGDIVPGAGGVGKLRRCSGMTKAGKRRLETERAIGQEILAAVHEIQTNALPVVEAREKVGLSQAEFARLQ
jgi:hypothetical protein